MSVYITRGMRLIIPKGGMTVDFSDPNSSENNIEIEVSLSMFHLWLEIALPHLVNAKEAHENLKRLFEEGKDKELGEFLEKERDASMQSIIASATAIDAFYDEIKEYANFSEEDRTRFRENRTSRPKQIKETIRRVFDIKKESMSQLDNMLSTIYRFRGWAIHPPSESRKPQFHKVIKTGVEWRFIAFSYGNAHEILRGTISCINQLLEKGNIEEKPTHKLCKESLPFLDGIISTWNENFTPKFDQNNEREQGSGGNA